MAKVSWSPEEIQSVSKGILLLAQELDSALEEVVMRLFDGNPMLAHLREPAGSLSDEIEPTAHRMRRLAAEIESRGEEPMLQTGCWEHRVFEQMRSMLHRQTAALSGKMKGMVQLLPSGEANTSALTQQISHVESASRKLTTAQQSGLQ